MKLSLKLSLVLVSLVAIPLLVVGSVAYFKLLDNAQKKHFVEMETTLGQVSRQLENLVENAKANAALFANNPQLKNYLLTEDESVRYDLLYRPLLNEYIAIQKAFPQYYEIRVILPDGFEDLRSVNREIPNKTEELGRDASFQYIGTAPESLLSRIERNPDNGEIACYIYKRIELINKALEDSNTKPKLRGYFSLTANLQPIIETLEKHILGTNGGVLLTNASGQILIAPPNLEKQANIKQHLPEHLNQQQEHDLLIISLGEQNYYYSHQQLYEDIWLHALLPEQDILRDSRTISAIVSKVTFFSLFGALSLALFFMRSQILAPIYKLQSAVSKIGAGEELVQIEIDRKDEFGQLGAEFNRMSLTLKNSNDQIRSMAYCDSLTQLSNRFMFNRTIHRLTERARKNKTKFALLYLDLIKFKQVNDTFGHQAGDQFLKTLADRLLSNLRSGDVASRVGQGFVGDENLARLGGDEFSILLPNIDASNAAAKAAERIIQLIEKPVIFEGQEHLVSVSIGIAIYPDDGTSSVELIKNADIAMYEAKKRGKGSYQFFSQQLSQQSIERTRLEQRLLHAVENNAFELHYQPIIKGKDLSITSLEALIRWTDEELGSVPPDRFIPIAEDMGQIHSIGNWVLNEACQQIARWNDSDLSDVKVAINVSGRQFEKEDFVDNLLRTVKKSGISCQSIYLELTESALIQGDDRVLGGLIKLRQQGIKIALDDFGTGYSSLSYLQNLPIDILKIDRSFIQELGNRNNNIILSAIITMAHALGMRIVAEGIEDQAQFAFLKKEKCDFLQGYLFSKPGPADEITRKLMKQHNQNPDQTDIRDLML